MPEDPGNGTVYISTVFMEKLGLNNGDPVEIVDSDGYMVQAWSHPNPWTDTRMVALDHHTMEKTGLQLFGQVKLRKASCKDAQGVTLEIPTGVNLTRVQFRAMLEKANEPVVSGRDHITLTTNRGQKIQFRLIRCDPEDLTRISRSTRVHLVNPDGNPYVSKKETTFRDVGGLEDAVRKVREIVQLPLRHPEIFHQLGVDPPRGVLLHGPSGTGKTLIARAVAGETGCYFKAISGTEIMDKHYGESEAKLRSAFEDAYKNAPAIVFIDEIDALAPRRDTAEGEVERRVTAQLLALMDGMEDRGDVIVLAATNLPNVLDTALRRPGRFDREVLIGVPDRQGRREILKIHSQSMPLGDVDLNDLADKTHGFVGADIKALCQEAGYKALQRILPGLADTHERLTDDFLDAISVETGDFAEALKEMRPASARSFEVDLRRAGWGYIAGYRDELEFLNEIVLWPLLNIEPLRSVGVRRLSGILLTGPSGVGKTLMARSLGRESGFNVIEIRGPELISKYVGESERNIRELFRRAKEMAPTVLILDGVDAMTCSGWSESKVIDRTVNQLVLEMNALGSRKPVFVVATCGRASDLPPALRATGKFAAELPIKKPDQRDRVELFKFFLNSDRITFGGDIDLAAAAAEGLTGGDIEEVCRRTVIEAARIQLEKSAAVELMITVSTENLLKMLDRWKLTSGLGRVPAACAQEV
jgi:transitional endoplasmic reticulum ATPase